MVVKIVLYGTIFALILAVAPQYSIIYLIDSVLSLFNWIDGIHSFNTQVPNYVDGNWQPIHNEMDRVMVTGAGRLPKNLIGGMYVRAGANPRCWPPGNRMRNHAFNGESMLHRYRVHSNAYDSVFHCVWSLNVYLIFRIEFSKSKEILFSNSWIRGEHMEMTNWQPMQECPFMINFGDVVNGGYFFLPKMFLLKLKSSLLGGKPRPILEKAQPGSTSVVKHANRILACTESYLPYEITIKKQGIKSIGFTDLDGMLKQKNGPKYGTFSAHPIIDPNSGEMFFFSKNGGPDALPQVAYG